MLLVTLLALVLPAAALAHGDPPTQYLETQNLFLPLDGSTPDASEEQLRTLLADARAKKFAVRVAVVGSRSDLEAAGPEGKETVPYFDRPAAYAPVLGHLLPFRDTLLVVMPSGYGVYRGGRPVASQRQALAKLPAPSSAPDLAQAAVPAVQAIASLEGVGLATPPLVESSGSEWRDRLLIVVGSLLVVAAVSGFLLLRRRR